MTTTHRTVAADSRATLVTGRAPLARALAQGLRDRGRPVEALEPQDALDAIRGGRAGGIVHVPGAACAATVGEQATHAAGAVESAARVLEAARIAGLRGRIVLLSSTGVYGDRAGSITESAEARPATPTAAGSLALEQLGARYRATHGLDVLVLRFGELYGRGLCLPAAIGDVFAAAAAGTPLDLARRCHETFHLLHVEDARRAVLAALDADVAGAHVFNVTDGETHSLCQVAERIRDCYPDSRIDTGPRRPAAVAASIDIGAADRVLGYRPRWGLARGIDDYAEWCSAQQRDGTAA